jgi:hypothetical protein
MEEKMGREYRVLVIDDDIQMIHYFDSISKLIKKKYNYEIVFHTVSTDSEYDDSIPYDVLLVDYNLRNGFVNYEDGKDFIRVFRQANKVSKVIFYSSEFEYEERTGNIKIPLESKDIYDLINVYKIDGLVSKNNLNMMRDVIHGACESLDIITSSLFSTISRYPKTNFKFVGPEGKLISSQDMLHHLMSDSDTSKKFKEQIIDTIFTLFMSIKE